MKYMTKQFGSGDEPWSDGEPLFNAIVWATGTRMWGASKKLTDLMRKPAKESDVTWDTIELLMSGTQLTVWSRNQGTLFPNFCEDFDDLCPEESVTKELWKKMVIRCKMR